LDIRPTATEHLAEQVARAVAGDRVAFEALVRHYQRPLFSFLGRMGLRQSEAEELAQEAFVRVWQHLARYQVGQGAFSTWLFTIAKRLALNELDRAAHRLQNCTGETLEVACDQHGPEQFLQLRQRRAALLKALRSLPMGDRSVLALTYVQELSLSDVALIEGCSESAVKARLHRARHRLREALPELNPNALD
jgi:RNA polymerase sigma-70 factor (ECF subfamily)